MLVEADEPRTNQERGRLLKEPWKRRGLLLAGIGIVAVLQQLTPSGAVHWLYVLQRLYYVPIVLAGLSLGWRDGLVAALLSGVAFALGTPSIWRVSNVDVLDECLEVCVFSLVGLVSGILADRRKVQEDALRKTSDELRRAHQELQQNFDSMKRAERLCAMGQLSAGLAHEIRNPLASIEGAAGVLQREGQTPERQREFLDIIQKECRRLNKLLSSFLDFAKPRQPDVKVVEIDRLFDSVMVLARHADGRSLDVRKEIQPGLSTLECDPEQLKQVLLNLLINAIQAMPRGGNAVLRAGQDDARVTIDVCDEGGGISDSDLDRIFDPFFTTRETGTGLGLSVAHQIVGQHGGTLTVARNSNQGTTIRISLPRGARQVT